jgi:multimeric flavodoxin WrbA
MGSIDVIKFESLNQTVDFDWIEKYADEALIAADSLVKKRVLYIVELDELGQSDRVNQYLKEAIAQYNNSGDLPFESQVAALIVRSESEFFTKSFAKKFMFHLNQLGCEFIGHPLVERIVDGQNFRTWSKATGESLDVVEKEQVFKLITRLGNYSTIKRKKAKLLVLHAGHKDTSNTLMYWEQIKEKLEPDLIQIDELHVEEGKISDCYGCSFETCMYYAKEKACFYGGFVVEDLYPKIEQADMVLWICPNYNDAISAKLMAVINRLTALYRSMNFYEKYLLSIVVSGNSGNDSVAMQLLGALCINKGFRLPSQFAAMAIANEPGDILSVMDLDRRVKDYVNSVHKLTNKIVTK